MTDSQSQVVTNRFNELIKQIYPFTDAELQELRVLLSKATNAIVRDHILGKAQLRTILDLIESIRKFDNVSTELIQTTNRLTGRVLTLTIWLVVLGFLGLIMGGASLWLSYLALQRH